MRDEHLLSQLEDLAHRLGIKVRYEKVNLGDSSDRGGLCRIRGDYFLIIDSRASTREKIHVTLKALNRFDLGDLHIIPVIRDLLETFKE